LQYWIVLDYVVELLLIVNDCIVDDGAI